MRALRPLTRLARLARLARLHTTPPHHAARIPIPTTTTTPTPTLQQRLNSPLPITPHCPPPTCPCTPTPAPPLPIDTTTPLANALPRYHRHLLISTSRADWAPKIELDGDGGLAQHVKTVAAARSLRDPFAPTLVTNSSFAPEAQAGEEEAAVDSAYVFPGSIYIPRIPRTAAAVEKLIRSYLLPGGSADAFEGARAVHETVVLICSHGSRDARCGVVAPALMEQFSRVLGARGISGRVKVAYTSHLSGHKFAGNVVVYLPAGEGREGGLGVWYGRVGTEQVEGIVDETVIGGRVVGELCRGVVGAGGAGGRG